MALFFGLLLRSHKCITYNLIINLFWKGDFTSYSKIIVNCSEINTNQI